jgi:hypothetical protein
MPHRLGTNYDDLQHSFSDVAAHALKFCQFSTRMDTEHEAHNLLQSFSAEQIQSTFGLDGRALSVVF